MTSASAAGEQDQSEHEGDTLHRRNRPTGQSRRPAPTTCGYCLTGAVSACGRDVRVMLLGDAVR